MARPEVDYKKYTQVAELIKGDIIQLTTGEKVTFVKCKQKDFSGIMEDGKTYSIFINKFDKILENAKPINQQEENNNILSQLKKGDWFYINKSDKALLFKFEKIENNKVIGINPIDNGITKIDMSFQFGLLN